jgi:hypothetical protein
MGNFSDIGYFSLIFYLFNKKSMIFKWTLPLIDTSLRTVPGKIDVTESGKTAGIDRLQAAFDLFMSFQLALYHLFDQLASR